MKPSPESHWDLVPRGMIKPLLGRMKVEQRAEDIENLRDAAESGRPIFAFPNHVSWADHFLIMNKIDDVLTIPTSALAKEKYYKYPVFGWVMRRANHIPITNVKLCFARWFKETEGRLPHRSDFIKFMTDSGADDLHEVNVEKRLSLVRTAAHVGEMLDRGRAILGYPEGTRSQRSSMQPIKTGIIQLPFEYKGCVVPSAITGTDRILPRGGKWYEFLKLFFVGNGAVTNVRFGRAIDYTELLDKCQEKFENIEDMVNLENVKELRTLIEEGRFRSYTVEAERFERIFDESSLIVMRAVNKILPEEYQTEHVEIKYPR
jgi:1-acyl-sn-glycerol-3-phosphate acyltransferase